jgi:beta-propeller repeat-containing protein/ASPM-SPD-2-Hydin domain-containing protein/HYDIN/CFA65/VesB family protein
MGATTSTNFPTTNALQASNAGGNDAFVAKLNPTGSALVYSTYLGGSGYDVGTGIAVDSAGNAYVTGSTASTNLPTMNPLQPVYGGGQYDVFLAKFNSTGSSLIYSTYLGGSDYDIGDGIAVDSSGNAYVTGTTASTNFPTVNPLQPAKGGGADVFVAALNPAGSALVYSTYLGGSGDEQGLGIAVDSAGNAYVTGNTTSTNFPTMNPLQPAFGGGFYDAFVAELNAAGSALVYSTYLGGSNEDQGFSIAVDGSGEVYVTGMTYSTNFPSKNALQASNAGGFDAFVAKLNATGSDLVYSTYLGGSGTEYGQGIAVDSSGNAYVIGSTASTNFPTMKALQASNAGGGSDAFVAKIAKPSSFVTLAPPKLNFGNQTVGITSASQNSTLTNTGELALTITSIEVTGPDSADFARTHNCPASLAAHKSCTITVTFAPTTTGTRTASVSITDNAPNSPQMLPLTGVGVLPGVTFSSTSLTFLSQVVFTTSKAETVKLTNSGRGVLSIKTIAVTRPFGQTHNCGITVNPGGSCTISVTFSPKTINTLTGSLSVTDNAPGSPQRVTLKGTGTYIQLTPASENFGNQPVGTKSLPKTITLTNKGSVTVDITGISITGTNAKDFAQTHTCGTSVAKGASCFIKVTFTPSATGTRTAQVSISDNGGGSPQKVSLTGAGT